MEKVNCASIFFDRKMMKFRGLDEISLNSLRERYKSLDIDRELTKMGLWLMSPKGKSRKGTLGFVVNWLNNAAGSHCPSLTERVDALEKESPLKYLLFEYLENLWSKSLNVLEFNTIKRSKTFCSMA